VAANRKASEAEVPMAIPLQCDLCGVPGSHPRRGVCTPEASPILLAKTTTGLDRADRPGHTVGRAKSNDCPLAVTEG